LTPSKEITMFAINPACAEPETSQSVRFCHESCGQGEDRFGTVALNALQSSDYAELRKLRCEVTEAAVIVQGVVSSYYLKQMAQTIIQRLKGVQSVMNLVEVRQSE
jgi:hypothetical protein